jgi:hypothetical protein
MNQRIEEADAERKRKQIDAGELPDPFDRSPQTPIVSGWFAECYSCGFKYKTYRVYRDKTDKICPYCKGAAE